MSNVTYKTNELDIRLQVSSQTAVCRHTQSSHRALILFVQTLALYKSFTYLLTKLCYRTETTKVTLQDGAKTVQN